MDDRLTKEKWVRHGLLTLEKKGFGALKADPLAKALKVSRGSFYWHFKDIGEFQKEVLGLWRQRATVEVIEEVDGSANASGRLGELIRRAFNSDRDLERAVRAWAIQSPDAARVVISVDVERISYISDLLVSQGVSSDRVQSYASFLYWAYLGQMMMPNGDVTQFIDIDVEKIVDLFCS